MSLPDNYSAASGVTIYGGRAAPPSGLPLWAQGAPLNAWIPIPNTGSTVTATNWVGGAPSQMTVNNWGSMALTSDGEIIVPAAGGHTDGTDNRVAGLDLMMDVPGWVTRTAQSPAHVNEQPYEADGKPTARHSYYSVFWSEILERVILVGEAAAPGSGNSNFPTMDGWNPVTNTWDAAGTYPYLPISTNGTYPTGVYPEPVAGHYMGAWPGETSATFTLGTGMDSLGNIWAGNKKYDPATETWSTPLTTTVTPFPRSPWAVDSLRNQMFGMCWGDNQGYDEHLGIVAAKQAGTVQTAITFNASAATAQFALDRPQYGGMDYDPDNDRFLWYEGRRTYTGTPEDTGRVGRVYVITPNSGAVWDMSIFTYASGATPPAETNNSGMCNRMRYVPQLSGFVMVPSQLTNSYFMRTA